LLEQKLRQLEDLNAHNGPSPTSPSAGTLAATGIDHPDQNNLSHRKSRGPKYSTDFSTEESQIASIGHAIETSELLDAEQIQAFHHVLTTEVTILNEELRGKCTTTDNMYPTT